MKKKKYTIKKVKEWFIVCGAEGKEHTFHKTRKLALYRIRKELDGEVI